MEVGASLVPAGERTDPHNLISAVTKGLAEANWEGKEDLQHGVLRASQDQHALQFSDQLEQVLEGTLNS